MTVQVITTSSSEWTFHTQGKYVVRKSLTGKPHGRVDYQDPEGDTYYFESAGVLDRMGGDRVIYISGPGIPYGSLQTGRIGTQAFEDIPYSDGANISIADSILSRFSLDLDRYDMCDKYRMDVDNPDNLPPSVMLFIFIDGSYVTCTQIDDDVWVWESGVGAHRWTI